MGDTITALVGEPFVLDEVVIDRMQGTPKARVLPEPVSAMPMTSRPDKRKGQEADWIGVGVVNAVKGEEESLV